MIFWHEPPRIEASQRHTCWSRLELRKPLTQWLQLVGEGLMSCAQLIELVLEHDALTLEFDA
eukprot:scaffold262370_cov33-Tisochrysis_lutea.AAC.2